MSYTYRPLDRACKSIVGAIPRGSTLALNVYRNEGGEADFSANVCYLVLFRDGKEEHTLPMQRTEYGWTINLKFNQIGLYFYYFSFGNGRYLSCGRFREGVVSEQHDCWQITVYDETYRTPEWFKGGVMYQIFPDRFYKAGSYPVKPYQILRDDWGGQPSYRPNEYGKVLNNDFFGGNLNGVTEKLDVLARLHVTVIYFNPIFEAYSNHRYDTGDYMRIDGLLGTEEDLDRLVEEARKRGIRIVLDGVFNHTGDDSRYFNKYGRYPSVGAFQSQSSPYAEWYHFRRFPDSYESWWGIETLPALNEASPTYQEFVFGENGVIKTWLRHGVCGYRLDVADELPDFFLKKLRTAVKEENGEAIIIGEVWEDASNKIAYSERRQYLQGNELDSVMNYPLKDAIINFMLSGSTVQLRETLAMLIDNYPKTTLDSLMNILGTHDTPRILTVLGNKPCRDKDEMAITSLSEEEKRKAKEKVRMAAVLQYTLPGVPCVFYGDEIGMEGYMDPFCRGCYDWDAPDSALRGFYEELGRLRGEELVDIFREGEYHEVYADRSCIVFERRAKCGSAYIYCNNSSNEYRIRLKGSYLEHLSGKIYRDLLDFGAFTYGILTKCK